MFTFIYRSAPPLKRFSKSRSNSAACRTLLKANCFANSLEIPPLLQETGAARLCVCLGAFNYIPPFLPISSFLSLCGGLSAQIPTETHPIEILNGGSSVY